MLQNPCKTLGFKKNMVYKIPPGGGGKPYPASGLFALNFRNDHKSYKLRKPRRSTFKKRKYFLSRYYKKTNSL